MRIIRRSPFCPLAGGVFLHGAPLLTILVCLAPPLALAGSAAPPDPMCFMWRVESETATAYLLGSFHLASEELYPLDPAIEEAFAGSDHLVVEVDMSNPQNIQEAALLVMQEGAYPDGQTLRGSIAPETWRKLTEVLADLGLDPDIVDPFRPWYVSMLIGMQQFQGMGFDPALGIDLHFMAEAAGVMPILELETVTEQLDILAGGSEAEQELFLQEALEQATAAPQTMTELLQAWQHGDHRLFAELVNGHLSQHPSLQEFQARLLDRRNERMAERIAEFMQKTGTYFVVVGSAHLVGERSILDLLAQRDCRVQQIAQQAPYPVSERR